MKTFYTIVVTQTLSLVGSRMTSIAVGIWVFTTTGNTTPLLLTSFFNELPGMLFGSLSGVYVDRWNRRKVLMLADFGQAIGSLLLLVSFLSGEFKLWHLYILAFLSGSFATLQQPAEHAAFTMLLPAGQLERGNGIRQMAFPLAGVLAPVLAGFFYSLVGVEGVLIIDMVTFLSAVAAINFIHIPSPIRSPASLQTQGSLWREFLTGIRFLLHHRGLYHFVLYLTVINFLLNGPLELAIPYLIEITGSEVQMGSLVGVMSLGAFSGAVLISAWGGTRPRMYTILGGLILSGVMFLVYGSARTPLLLGLSLYLLMIPLPIMNALATAILQVKTPPDMQGRIFAAVDQLGYLGSTASFLLTGPLVDRILKPAADGAGWQDLAPLFRQGPGAAISLVLVVAGVLILAFTSIAFANPQNRRLEYVLPDYEARAEASSQAF